MKIKLIGNDEIISLLYILNEVTLDLHKTGIQPWSYPWKSSDIAYDVHEGNVYGVYDEKDLIGTFKIKEVTSLHYTCVEIPSKELSQIAVHPSAQGKNIGAYIIHYAQSHVNKLNQALYLDCWAGNEKLKTFYTLNGFNYLGDFPEEDYVYKCISI